MGKESKVTIVLREADCNKMADKLLSTCNKKLTDVFNRIGILKDPDETYVCLQTEWTNWYEGDKKHLPEVDLIMNHLKNVRHSYIRWGEEYGDLEFDIKEDDENGYDEDFNYLIEPLVHIRGVEQFGFNQSEDKKVALPDEIKVAMLNEINNITPSVEDGNKHWFKSTDVLKEEFIGILNKYIK